MKLTDDEQGDARRPRRQGEAEGDGAAGALRRSARRRAVRGHDERRGCPGQSNLFLENYYKDRGDGGYDAIFSHFDLDSDELVDVPPRHRALVPPAGRLRSRQLAAARRHRPRPSRSAATSEHDAADRGIKILKTCTPYLVGNVPKQGEHCAWMESSAVVYCNSVLGARTNTEGRESTSAAMLTGKIPDWGFHRDEHRRGTHLIEVEVDSRER